jgi:hypothetical protein
MKEGTLSMTRADRSPHPRQDGGKMKKVKMQDWEEGYSLAVSHCRATVKSWTDTEVLLLRSGEMTAQEVRTIKAVLNAILRSFDSMVKP